MHFNCLFFVYVVHHKCIATVSQQLCWVFHASVFFINFIARERFSHCFSLLCQDDCENSRYFFKHGKLSSIIYYTLSRLSVLFQFQSRRLIKFNTNFITLVNFSRGNCAIEFKLIGSYDLFNVLSCNKRMTLTSIVNLCNVCDSFNCFCGDIKSAHYIRYTSYEQSYFSLI